MIKYFCVFLNIDNLIDNLCFFVKFFQKINNKKIMKKVN